MKNNDVIEMYVNGAHSGRTRHLAIEGDFLVNYDTVLAARTKTSDGYFFSVDTNKYSTTTTRIQNRLRTEIRYMGYKIVNSSAINYTPKGNYK